MTENISVTPDPNSGGALTTETMDYGNYHNFLHVITEPSSFKAENARCVETISVYR